MNNIIEHAELTQLINKWQGVTGVVLDLDKVDVSKLQELLKETYATLIAYHKNDLVPKEISKLFLGMEDFLYFSSLMEDKECGNGFYYFQKVYTIIDALKDGFFSGDYGCVFPKIKLKNHEESIVVFDMESESFDEMVM